MLHLRRVNFVVIFVSAKPFNEYKLTIEIDSGYQSKMIAFYVKYNSIRFDKVRRSKHILQF